MGIQWLRVHIWTYRHTQFHVWVWMQPQHNMGGATGVVKDTYLRNVLAGVQEVLTTCTNYTYSRYLHAYAHTVTQQRLTSHRKGLQMD